MDSMNATQKELMWRTRLENELKSARDWEKTWGHLGNKVAENGVPKLKDIFPQRKESRRPQRSKSQLRYTMQDIDDFLQTELEEVMSVKKELASAAEKKKYPVYLRIPEEKLHTIESRPRNKNHQEFYDITPFERDDMIKNPRHRPQSRFHAPLTETLRASWYSSQASNNLEKFGVAHYGRKRMLQ